MEGTNLNMLDLMLQSGIVVKVVLILLVGASILSWAIIFQKRKVIRNIEESNEEFNKYFKEHSSLADIFEHSNNYKNSSTGVMFQKGYSELSKIKEKLAESGNTEDFNRYIQVHGLTALERALQTGASTSSLHIEQRLSLLASIGSVSPFIGLFGTVWGIIDSFTGLAQGGGSIEAVAPGIAEALVATAIGLAAAIPATWAYNLFIGKISKINTDMENFGQEFMNLIERSLLISKGKR